MSNSYSEEEIHAAWISYLAVTGSGRYDADTLIKKMDELRRPRAWEVGKTYRGNADGGAYACIAVMLDGTAVLVNTKTKHIGIDQPHHVFAYEEA